MNPPVFWGSMEQARMLAGLEVVDRGSNRTGADGPPGAARLLRPDRSQMVFEDVCLDRQLAPDHRARLVWEFVVRADVTELERRIGSVEGRPGAPAIDPRLLLALWLYATLDGVGSARELARLCEEHMAYRWLCGRVGVNHHTLSDFRSELGEYLDGLLSRMIASLIEAKAVEGSSITQDGTKVRAAAGSGSFRRRERLEELQKLAREHVERLKAQDPEGSARSRAARERAGRERLERVQAALAAMPELEAIKAKRGSRKDAGPARASTTDAEARRMKMADGGTRPAYNVQLATDTKSRAIVGVKVVTAGNDKEQAGPMREQVQKRTGVKVTEHIADGGYVNKEQIEEAEQAGVACLIPLPKDRQGRPCGAHKNDGPGLTQWRARMQTPEAAEKLRRRSGTAETPNAELKAHRAMDRMLVRGTKAVTSVILLGVIAYNLLHFGRHLMT
jgi:transposase